MAQKKPRKCQAKTRAGKPCKANPLLPGTVIDKTTVTGKWCRQHDKDLPETSRIGGAQPGAGRPKTPRVIDVLRERLEERADEVIEVYLEAMAADRVVVTGYGEDASAETMPDHAIRLKAVEALNDRAYGKPKQVSEISGPEGGPVEHARIPTEEEFQAAVAQTLQEAGAA